MTTAQQQPQLLTIQEVAEACGVHVRTIKNWMARGCPHRKLGGHVVRFELESVLAWDGTAQATLRAVG